MPLLRLNVLLRCLCVLWVLGMLGTMLLLRLRLLLLEATGMEPHARSMTCQPRVTADIEDTTSVETTG